MTTNAFLQLALFVVVLVAVIKPLGAFMARVYENKPCGLDKLLSPLERLIYRLCGVDPTNTGPYFRIVTVSGGVVTCDYTPNTLVTGTGNTPPFAVVQVANANASNERASAALAFPVVGGWHVKNVVVDGLTIDGNRAKSAQFVDGCRAGGIYLHECEHVTIRNSIVRHFNGDGICSGVSHHTVVENCVSENNAGLGLHPSLRFSNAFAALLPLRRGRRRQRVEGIGGDVAKIAEDLLLIL